MKNFKKIGNLPKIMQLVNGSARSVWLRGHPYSLLPGFLNYRLWPLVGHEISLLGLKLHFFGEKIE